LKKQSHSPTTTSSNHQFNSIFNSLLPQKVQTSNLIPHSVVHDAHFVCHVPRVRHSSLQISSPRVKLTATRNESEPNSAVEMSRISRRTNKALCCLSCVFFSFLEYLNNGKKPSVGQLAANMLRQIPIPAKLFIRKNGLRNRQTHVLLQSSGQVVSVTEIEARQIHPEEQTLVPCLIHPCELVLSLGNIAKSNNSTKITGFNKIYAVSLFFFTCHQLQRSCETPPDQQVVLQQESTNTSLAQTLQIQEDRHPNRFSWPARRSIPH
jgi:hypothetical protein